MLGHTVTYVTLANRFNLTSTHAPYLEDGDYNETNLMIGQGTKNQSHEVIVKTNLQKGCVTAKREITEGAQQQRAGEEKEGEIIPGNLS